MAGFLFPAFPSARSGPAAGGALRHCPSLGRPSPARTHAAGGRAVNPAVRSVAAELLAAGAAAASAALMTRTEPVRPAARLPDRELGDRTRGRLLPFLTRQRRANQPAMDRSFFAVALAIGIARFQILLRGV